MAIIKTRTVQKIEVTPDGDGYMLTVIYNQKIDDPDDDDLPIERRLEKVIRKNTIIPPTQEGEHAAVVPTDYSGEDALVQTIAAAIWAD